MDIHIMCLSNSHKARHNHHRWRTIYPWTPKIRSWQFWQFRDDARPEHFTSDTDRAVQIHFRNIEFGTTNSHGRYRNSKLYFADQIELDVFWHRGRLSGVGSVYDVSLSELWRAYRFRAFSIGPVNQVAITTTPATNAVILIL